MDIFIKMFRKQSNFKAGGLIPSRLSNVMGAMKTPSDFMAPRKLDFRDMCIQTSNQGKTPHCAGYATAGYIEVLNWQINHYPKQIDGDAIYAEAKKIDGDNGDGTTLDAAITAALNMKLIKGKPKYINNVIDEVKFAIHQHITCIGGFMITNEWNMVGSDGVVPALNKPRDIGGHAVLICGYDPDYAYIQNSWGTAWGKYGFCKLSWAQFSNEFMNGVVVNNV